MNAFIPPPPKIPFFLRIGIWIAERITDRPMLPARILSWYPKAAVGSGVMESLVAHHEGRLNERLLKLVRMAASHTAACPFCVDMNSYRHRESGISDEEALAVQGQIDLDAVASLAQHERLAIRYARLVSHSPLHFPAEFITELTKHFNEREIVIMASTAAQVNYWARLIQALGIPPAGFN